MSLHKWGNAHCHDPICFKYQLKNNIPLLKYQFIFPIYKQDWKTMAYDLYTCINYLSTPSLSSCLEGNEDREHYFFKCMRYSNISNLLVQETRNYHPFTLILYSLVNKNRYSGYYKYTFIQCCANIYSGILMIFTQN